VLKDFPEFKSDSGVESLKFLIRKSLKEFLEK
jgi:hypothetical protein